METELFLWSKNKSICVSRGVSKLTINISVKKTAQGLMCEDIRVSSNM